MENFGNRARGNGLPWTFLRSSSEGDQSGDSAYRLLRHLSFALSIPDPEVVPFLFDLGLKLAELPTAQSRRPLTITANWEVHLTLYCSTESSS